ncbi:hypothetical protein KC19_7G110400 [Ceratodon purpureus]|uniref:Uncharacterized protein n=1 Tax=Ceratodon purpureus TaxID=3225 RepID=A0A8T0H8H2_CERPU|nr:hypothetical protein KC19_7G110400 [Ceratodon purpureus]
MEFRMSTGKEVQLCSCRSATSQSPVGLQDSDVVNFRPKHLIVLFGMSSILESVLTIETRLIESALLPQTLLGLPILNL